MFPHWKWNPLIKCKGKAPLGAATAIRYASQGQLRVERSWNVVWGKVQARASRPESCTHGCVSAVGAAPPRCLCCMKPESELATGISSDKDPQDTPLEPEPPLLSSSCQLLSYNDLGKQSPCSAPGMRLVEPALGDVTSILW